MATAHPLTTTTTRTSGRCPVHHQPESRCCPAEIADVLDTLRDLNINPHLVTETAFLLDVCGGCAERGDLIDTAVARISYTTHGLRRYSEDACPLCLPGIVAFWRRHATDVAVHLPVPAAMFGLVTS